MPAGDGANAPARLGLRWSSAFDAALPPLRADERMFKQIVLNLLTNAVKFTPVGGHIEVSAGLGDDGLLRLRG